MTSVTSVSLLVKNGVDAATIADRVGHTRASFTMDVYTHLFNEQRTAAVSVLDMLPPRNGKLKLVALHVAMRSLKQ